MTHKKKILIVGKNKKNNELLSDFFKKNDISSISVVDLKEANKKMDDKEIYLALVDVSGYGSSIWTFLKALFEKRIPFLVIYPPQIAQKTCPPSGSHGVLTKPVNPKVLLSLVKNFLAD